MTKRARARTSSGTRMAPPAQGSDPTRSGGDSLALLDHLPVLVWRSDRNSRCNYFNKAWLQFTGRRIQQELGTGWVSGVHPDDRQQCMRKYLAAFRKREPFELEYRLRKRDGEYRWICDIGHPLRGIGGKFSGYIGGCIDITERKLMAEALRQSEEQFASFARHMPGALFIKDEMGRYVYANPVCERAQRVKPGGWKGKTDAELFKAQSAIAFKAADREVRATGKPVKKIESAIWNDEVTHWLVTKFLIPGKTNSKPLLGGAGLNISELLRAEAALRASLEERVRLGRNLHDHVLQTIYSVGMTLEDCQRTTRDPKLSTALIHSINHLNDVIRDVRSYISGTASEEMTGRALQSALRRATRAIGARLRFRTNIDSTAARRVPKAAARHVLQIARESVSNAVRHSRGRNGILALTTSRSGVRLIVSDDGVGFSLPDSAGNARGLANMRERARQIGAKLELRSARGRGTRVVLNIPKAHRN